MAARSHNLNTQKVKVGGEDGSGLSGLYRRILSLKKKKSVMQMFFKLLKQKSIKR